MWFEKFIPRDTSVVNSSRCTLEAAGLVRPPVTESGKTGGEVRARDASAGCASSSSALRKETPVIYSHNPPFTTHIQHVQACAEQPVRFGAQGRIRTSFFTSRAAPRKGVFKKLTQSSQSAPIRQSAFQQRRNLSIHEWRSAQLLDSVCSLARGTAGGHGN